MARPRATSFSPEEMVELGKEMIEWISKKEDILHLSEWYTIHKMFTYKEWKSFIQKQEFIPYYEQALKIVGIKYLDKTSNVRDGISQRWQRLYFGDLREDEDQTIDEEYSRKLKLLQEELKMKADQGNQTPEEIKEQLDALLSLLGSAQSSRKIDSSKSNAEIKS